MNSLNHFLRGAWCRRFWLVFSVVLVFPLQSAEPLKLHSRRQVQAAKGSGDWRAEEKVLTWDPAKTAIVICDMWNQHWCKGATERVAEMAPRMNEVVQAARAKGVFIIHAPSDTMKFYEGTPQRKRAQSAPISKPPVELKNWCHLDPAKEAPLPIDDSDGGCDDLPQCKQGGPWKRQIATIEIADQDAITDSSQAYNLLQERGIENVIVMGVHANMCVLGRPFSIRQMVNVGKNVVLMRDMTDTMYNSRSKPFVSHFRGTDLVVDHIERYWCHSITSVDFLGGKPFRFSKDKAPKVVFMIGEDEYNTKETLPAFGKSELAPRGFDLVVVQESPTQKHSFPGLEALKEANLLVMSVRRRGLSPEHLSLVRDYLESGKPLVAIRTSSHAFEPKGKDADVGELWAAFDDEILGADYQGHYGNKPPGPGTIVNIPEKAKLHPVLNAVPRENHQFDSHLYKYPKTNGEIEVLMRGWVEGKEDEVHPVTWINQSGSKKIVYTSLGSEDDFHKPSFRQLLLNACLWSVGLPITTAKSDVPQVSAKNGNGPLTPEESADRFTVFDDLKIEQVLAEPDVRQPVHLSWDEKRRLWVVQYLQYPEPAGLTLLSKDQFWRAVYDKVPPPPPNHFRGADKITIHEDTDGDGRYDRHKTFLDGLNIVTAVAKGRGGAWVLNPPYLLFYADKNNDDTPDGDPVVHLAGFGIEDTHSVANSLRWGPDGWLYGAHGSTVTANIVRPGLDQEPIVHALGQHIWRYHPETREFEIFAEGGGNAFGVELDDQARIFSGHNGGNTRGFHYVQGGYLQKGFEKHGPLSNPYAFGYFRQMAHEDVERFTHTFVIYGGGALPEKYNGKLFGVEPLQGRVVMSEITRDRSSFKTHDLGHAVLTSDKYFKPVDIKVGPDGAIYIADWYDRQVTHTRNYQGEIDKSNGRIYRLQAKNAGVAKPFDANKLSSADLLKLLEHSNRWIRQTALVVIGDRKDVSLIPRLKSECLKATGQHAVELLWALNLSGGFNEDIARELLNHSESNVRAWTVRLLGDSKQVSQSLSEKLAELARSEPSVEVRSQLASSARRLLSSQSLPIVRQLLGHSEDSSDIHLPLLLWWAIEAKAGTDRDAVLELFGDPALWDLPIVREEIIGRLMRRYALAGTRADLLACARLLNLAPREEHKARLMAGFEEAFKGRSMSILPAELKEAIASSGGETLALALRRGDGKAAEKAVALIADEKVPENQRLEYIEIFGQVKHESALPVLLRLTRDKNHKTQKAALNSLRLYDDPKIATDILVHLSDFSAESKIAAFNLLATREEWSRALLEEAATDNSIAAFVPVEIVDKLRTHEALAASVESVWGPREIVSSAEMAGRIRKFTSLIQSGSGDPFRGQNYFNLACSSCHKLFGEGGQIGPDLTAYGRQNLEIMLLHIVNPSAEIREGYENFNIETKDGRALSGFIADKDNQVLVLRGFDGENIIIPQSDLAEMKASSASLMPEGLLEAFEDQQIRDLFAYLRSTQPLVKQR